MTHKKVSLLVRLLILFLVASGFWLEKTKLKGWSNSTQNRPNLILISLDSLRADHVSAYGYSRKTTPNIDNLAENGILFKNYITQAYLTPVSEAALHTGMYPTSSGMVGFDFVLPENILTLVQILKIYNYRTIALGNSPEFLLFPVTETFKRGFDIYKFERESMEAFGSTSLLVDYNVLPTQKEINETLNLLKEKGEPFFLWLAIGSIHYPYDGFPRIFGDLNYDGPLKDLPLSYGDADQRTGVLRWIFNNIFYKIKDKKLIEKINLNQEDIQYVIDKYDDKIFATDKWLGDFLEGLKKRNLEKNTIIVLASEHGEEFNEHGYIMHYDIFDSEIKTPLIIKNPKLKEGEEIIERQVQSIDVLPTILDFLNIPIPHQAEGNSLAPLIAGKSSDDFNEYVFVERIPIWGEALKYDSKWMDGSLPFFDVAIRTSEWKLIYRKSKDFQEKYSWWRIFPGGNKKLKDYELYNLKTDSQEKENVVDDYPVIAENLKERLKPFIEKIERIKTKTQRRETLQEYP